MAWTWSERLNTQAMSMWNGEPGESALSACKSAAAALGLSQVAEDGSCRAYRTPDGDLVNLWIEGIQSDRIEDGGFGFDDYTDWIEG